MRTINSTAIALLLSTCLHAADEPLFSGPQVGEPLPNFKAKGVLDDQAGEEFDLIAKADGKPVAIVFVHKLTRPSVGLTRLLMKYTASRSKDGLTSGIVFLTDDAPDTANWMKRARHALPDNVPLGISGDGPEGPGAYGLNRNVTLTVLLGKDNKVTANFALVQPSVEVDLPKILKETVAVVGSGKVPTLAQLGARRYSPDAKKKRNAGRGGLPPELATLVRALIQKDASEDDVAATAKKIEAVFEKTPATRKQVATIANRIISAGKLENYGTPAAQELLKKWSKVESDEKE